MIKPQTLKGFRDFLPSEARKRQYVIDILKKVFESYGFEPLETPALEYEEILLGKYGEEGDKLMYRFTDRGGRKVALRYDQTVPLARIIAQYGNQLPRPFKRHQIQPVWRAENTQKGRFREFLQCDADTIGTDSPLADAELLACVSICLKKLGIKNYKIKINSRESFEDLLTVIQMPKPFDEALIKEVTRPEIVRSIDKLGKISSDEVIRDLVQNTKFKEWLENSPEKIKLLKEFLDTPPIPFSKSNNLSKFFLYDPGWLIALKTIAEKAVLMGAEKDKIFVSPTLARGMDYYTGLIFEVVIDNYSGGSICGGGRYDYLIGMFIDPESPGDSSFPAVGFAFGFDRLMEAMDELKLFPDDLQTTKVLVTVFSSELLEKSIEISSIIRMNGINQELYLDENTKLEKQLKYADKKGIPYAIIIGPDEVSKNMVTLRNMKTREQKTISKDKLIDRF